MRDGEAVGEIASNGGLNGMDDFARFGSSNGVRAYFIVTQSGSIVTRSWPDGTRS